MRSARVAVLAAGSVLAMGDRSMAAASDRVAASAAFLGVGLGSGFEHASSVSRGPPPTGAWLWSSTAWSCPRPWGRSPSSSGSPSCP